jgi:hypothetical protein
MPPPHKACDRDRSRIAALSRDDYAAGLPSWPGPHFAPSGAPPLGQNTETNVSFASQLTEPSACTARRGDPAGPEAGAYFPSTSRRINSRLRPWRRILGQSPLRLLGITGDRECCAPACSGEASCPSACRPSFHSLQLSAPLVRGARPR